MMIEPILNNRTNAKSIFNSVVRSRVFKQQVVILVFAILVNSAYLLLPAATVRGATSISDLNERQEEVDKELARVRSEKNQLKNKTTNLKGDLAWLNEKSEAERDAYNKLLDELDNAYSEMELALAQAKAAEDDLLAKQEQYKERLQIMFENRNKNTLEMLLESDNIGAFLANIQFISIIAESDLAIIDELNSAKDEAMIKRQAASDYCAEMQDFVNLKNAEIEALKKNIQSTAANLTQAQAQLNKAIRDENALLEESKKLEAEIKRLQSSVSYYGGTMVWPAPGYFGINPTNFFGMRLHPIYKVMKMHNGIDINAPFNAKLVAAGAGKVIVAKTIPGYNSVTGNNYGGSGYGNYIIIDHGGGVSTIYAHCKLLKVKVGDKVVAGQWIAVAGSTGLSTGAHLHFEVRENGTPVDPLQTKYLGVRN